MQQHNWVEFLPIAQFVYNNSKHSITGVTPFYANYGKHPESQKLPFDTQRWSQNASLNAEQLKSLHQQMKEDLDFLNLRIAHYHNQHQGKQPTINKGDKVYLLRKHVKTNRPSDKLDFKKLGPYEITERINDVTFRLSLPASTKIANIFHISLLEPVPDGLRESPTPGTQILDEEPNIFDYTVESIQDSRYNNNTLEYYIKWEGYEDAENTWEPVNNLSCDRLIRKYHRQNPTKPR